MWGYERPNGGRGVGFTGGHSPSWMGPRWLSDGGAECHRAWTAGIKVPEGGVKSKSLTEDDLNANLDDYGKKQKRLKLPNVAGLEKAAASQGE